MYLCSNTCIHAVSHLCTSARSFHTHMHTPSQTQHNDIQQSSCRPMVLRWSQTLVILINHSAVVIRWIDDEKCSCQANMSLSQEAVVHSGKQLYPQNFPPQSAGEKWTQDIIWCIWYNFSLSTFKDSSLPLPF